MKLITALALLAAAAWTPFAFLEAAQLQAHIDARNGTVGRLARSTP